MKPRLVLFSGASENEIFPLEDVEELSIGRAETNRIAVADIDVSRHHCLIKRKDDGFYVEDLQSRNGTYLNDAPVGEALLRNGDCIRVGSILIMFCDDDGNKAPFSENFQFDGGRLVTRSEIKFAVEKNLPEIPHDLSVLAELGRAINEIEDSVELQNHFLEIILKLIPAERGAILLFDEASGDEPKSAVIRGRNRFEAETMTVSRTVTNRVLNENVALLSNDLMDTGLEDAESLIQRRVTALLCVPLNLSGMRGFIYLDTTNPDTVFTEKNLQQMAAVSVLMAAALSQKFSIEALQQENARLQTELEIETNLIGVSEEINKVFHLIKKVSPTDSNVLITGESGTGKELVAQTIHRNSRRREYPFIAINCAVLGENLLESELFGHEKGAFTGAHAMKKGKLEIAEGGTLFLDEIGELAPHLQAKLLRVLQEREFERVGGVKPIKSNVRIIAATNRNLQEEVKKGNFREDLFFRLNVVRINVPPLRERKVDIPLLAQHFVNKYSEKCNRRVLGVSRKAREILEGYEWFGNVRELENAIERAVVLGSTDTILPEDLPEEILGSAKLSEPVASDYHEQLLEAKRKIVISALLDADGSFTEAAQTLGIHVNNLHRLVRSLGIRQELKKV
jgi:Transcriptional regulator containing GAF, AAA-type ATPase, and DNA binding domains